MKVLVIHPGHGHSTADVFEGMCVGLEMNEVEVIRFDWGQMLRPLTALVLGAVRGGAIKDSDAERAHQFLCWLAGADALAVAAQHEVEAVLVINGLLFPPSRAGLFKQLGVPIGCYGTEAPYFEPAERDLAPFYTHWFTQERTAVARFAEVVPTTYLPMAYNPRLHQPGPADPDKQCDVVFVGGGFPERKALLLGEETHDHWTRLRHLLHRPQPRAGGVDWTGIDRAIHGTLWGLNLNEERGKFDFGRGQRYTEGAIPNDMTTAWHRSARIALNMHRRMTYIEHNTPLPPGAAESLGPRSYEIPASGGFLLSDDERPEIAEVFGDAAATFRAWDASDLERQIRYWLAHPDERERVRQAQLEAVRPHHWGSRARVLLEHLIA